MRHRIELSLVLGLLIAGLLAIFLPPAPAQNQTSATVTPADYLKWRNEYKNWGRWGADDQRGVSNLITADKSLSAIKLVKNGIVISLAHAVPQKIDPEVPAGSVFHRVTENIGPFNTIDRYEVSYHGLALAHMDAFCHFFLEGKMYNGYSVADNITPQTGCKKDDIMSWRDGVITRAVLYDIPQLKGVDWIEPGTPITRADLEAWEKKSGVKAGPGDVIMLYVGRWKRRAAKGPEPSAIPGYFADVIPTDQGTPGRLRRPRLQYRLVAEARMGRSSGYSCQPDSPGRAQLDGRRHRRKPRSRARRRDGPPPQAL